MAETEPRPPYRLTGVRARRLGERISDERAASPPTVTAGAAPARGGARSAATAIGQLGLVGLALGRGERGRGEPGWATATGWAEPGARRSRSAPVTPSPPTRSP